MVMEDVQRENISGGRKGKVSDLDFAILNRKMLEIKNDIHMILVILDGLQNGVVGHNVEEYIIFSDQAILVVGLSYIYLIDYVSKPFIWGMFKIYTFTNILWLYRGWLSYLQF